MMGRTLQGYVVKFNEPSQDLGGFIEVILPGAFTKAILRDDVKALFNHDPNHVLGRNRARTLELREDAVGLHCVIRPPDTSYARDLMENVSNGNVTQMSFSFRIAPGGDSWGRDKKTGLALRKVHDVVLFDCSAVTYPAYLQASLTVREDSIEHEAARPREQPKAPAPVGLHNRRRRLRLMELVA